LGATFPVGEEIRLEREIVLIDDESGHGELIAKVAEHLSQRFNLPTRVVELTLDASPAYRADREQWDVAILVRMWRGVIAGTNSLRDIDGLPVDYCPSCRELARKAVDAIREGPVSPL